ncbi:MAG: glycoside hydrolase family 78 protein [Niabella sp.]
MKRWIVLLIIAFLITDAHAQQFQIRNLKCEQRINPLGVDAAQPALSWELKASGVKNVVQTAYRIIVSDNKEDVQKNVGNIWDSKKVLSDQSIQVQFNGQKLLAAGKYYWKVIVWTNKSRQPVSGPVASWQMGLLTRHDWKNAQWIAYDTLPKEKKIVPFAHGWGDPAWGARANTLPYIRKLFTINKPVRSATAFICGLGHFEMNVNGKKAGDHFLDPGWTLYSKEAQYVTFDISDDIKRGDNAVGFMLGNGFYYIPGERYRKLTGGYGYPRLIARILLEYEDGSIENIITDNSWKAAPSPITFSSIYGGEDYNAGLEQPGWDTPEFNDAGWSKAVQTDGPPVLVSQMTEPLKMFERFQAVKKTKLADNKEVYDLGQNFAGIPFIKVSGNKGDTIRIIPSELLHANGTVNQRSSGGPHFYNYILKGSGEESWQPQFTYYGFRYLQVERMTAGKNSGKLPVVKDIGGIHTHNAAEQTGTFECSNELFNQTFRLINWAITSNMASVFTDCPHREKLGWLEEAHLMGSSVHYNYNIASLNAKVVRDMINSQTEDGLVPDIAPEYVVFEGGFRDSPEWGSALIILPWYNYLWYGDKRLLEEAYEPMKKYVRYLEKTSVEHIVMQGLGDWVDLGPNPPGESQLTPRGLTGTAIYYYDLDILGKIAALLNKPSDVALFKTKAADVKAAFNKKFFDPVSKNYGTGSQAANAMALYMGLVEQEYKEAVLANLVKNIRDRNNALSAGDIGYRYVLQVLQQYNRPDVIFDMNSRSDVPGYGYQLAKGATALVESWDVQDWMSQNHFMLGHIMEWFYGGLAGITQAPGSVGYKKIIIRPQPVGDVRFAKASFHLPYGPVTAEWRIDRNGFYLDVEVPSNTSAEIYLPGEKQPVKKGSGLYSFHSRYYK